MKALFITRHFLDQMLGGPNCSKAFVKALATIYDGMTLIYPEHENPKTQLPFLADCSDINLLPVHDRRSKMCKLVDMYMGHLHRFYRFVPEYLKEHSFDIIFIDHSFTASSGILEAALACGAKIVTIHHNVESQYIRDNQQSLLFRLPYNYYSLKAEKKAILHSDLNLVLTEEDRMSFVGVYPQKKASFHVAGVFEYEDASVGTISNVESNTFVISGSLCAKQTEMALVTFFDDYMDLLNEVCPDAQLIVAGRNPSKIILDKSKRFNNVKIVPNPENLVDEVVKGCYYLCPIYTGGGLKLRCMDALRVGLPVLAHKNAIRGYESIVQDGYMYSYSTKEEFVNSLHHLLSLHNCHANVAKSFVSHFSFEAGCNRLRNILFSYM